MLTPEGHFTFLLRFQAQFGTDDVAFAKQLAKEAKVGVTPGSAFGKGWRWLCSSVICLL